MPPRNRKNAFSFFLEKYVKDQQQLGRRISFKIAAEECGPKWQSLTADEKQYYFAKAAAAKNQRDSKEYKFTNLGVSLAEMERRKQEAMLKVERINNEITSTMDHLTIDSIKTHLFYIVHCNYLCKLEGGTYLPGEIAISEFNLEYGILRTYHNLINPGPIPLGYALDAKLLSEKVHGLPIPPLPDGISSYAELFCDIQEFITPGKRRGKEYPPLYCIEENIKVSENVLKSFSAAKGRDANFFRVYPISKMFFALKNRCADLAEKKNFGFPVLTNAIMEVEKDVFRYVNGISCTFHSGCDDKYHSCSLSVVQRYVYLICDYCCFLLRIQLVPGKHIWVNADLGGGSPLDEKEKHSKSSKQELTSVKVEV